MNKAHIARKSKIVSPQSLPKSGEKLLMGEGEMTLECILKDLHSTGMPPSPIFLPSYTEKENSLPLLEDVWHDLCWPEFTGEVWFQREGVLNWQNTGINRDPAFRLCSMPIQGQVINSSLVKDISDMCEPEKPTEAGIKAHHASKSLLAY